ncbi:MAG TPA: hypothetical protein VG890_16260 [Puia sp.]|nr:hypothetical protein [Puia sp.]
MRSPLSSIIYLTFTVFSLFPALAHGQPITGVWKGKVGSFHVELKLVRKGDSLTGTSYYYDSKNEYRRFSVKGYFDDRAMEVVWWDDQLLEDHSAHRFIGTGPGGALLSVAEFNCPGEGVMKLDGKTGPSTDDQKPKKELHLVKGSDAPLFPDEWDFVIDNYAYSVSNPGVIDSVEQIALNPVPEEEKQAPVAMERQRRHSSSAMTINDLSQQPAPADESIPLASTADAEPEKPLPALPAPAQTNEQRFTSRQKTLQQVIPVKGDSIELRFYDNAEIDGDSIAVFLNGQLLREHILLSDQAYSFKLPVNELQSDNELVMVAENLGSIPPNTSLMVALVGDKRYEAHLQSTEGSSALVRLVKP